MIPRPPARPAIAALLVLLAASIPACRHASHQDHPAGSSATDKEEKTSRLIVLAPEAEHAAGIETEVVQPGPFAVGVTVPCRLSPTPETPEEIEARLDDQAARAREVRAAAELERLRGLLAREVVAAKAVQAAEAEAAQARVDRQRAEAALDRLGLQAQAAPARSAGDIWALAEIDEAHASAIHAGDTAWVTVESLPEARFRGRVIALARFVKPQTRTLTGRIAVADPKHALRPQSLGTATIEVASREALSVPTAALLYAEAGRILFVRRKDGYERADVKVGAEAGGRSEIVAGLDPGATVVVRGASRLWGEWLKARQGLAGDDDEDEAGGDKDDAGGR
ncbi:MAG TPA: efflux RND transporter periplasmic adaptor subunit [Candidatus Polarisedimenticolia bacterium]|nr:efflux RND transporter periplasmic adaptor subunit [Candidatus Polarisedimenticolia bacterium]